MDRQKRRDAGPGTQHGAFKQQVLSRIVAAGAAHKPGAGVDTQISVAPNGRAVAALKLGGKHIPIDQRLAADRAKPEAGRGIANRADHTEAVVRIAPHCMGGD